MTQPSEAVSSASETADATAARLVRHGRMPWEAARELLTGTVCAWADLAGFHVAPASELPVETPLSSHLWAWAPPEQGTPAPRCVRVRFDVDEALIATLRLEGATSGTEDESGESVSVWRRPGLPWHEQHHRVGPLSETASSLRFELLELPGTTPVVFVRGTA